MKKLKLILAATLLLLTTAACGTDKAPATGSGGDAQTFAGTVDEVKSFMLIASDDEGNSYVFTVEDADVQVGDKVEITYTGDLDDMDSELAATAVKVVE